MPAEHSLDPSLLDAVAAQLTRTSHAALEASHELVAHYSETGDAPTQRAVDTMIDHAADALRALTNSLADSSHELETAAQPATGPGHGQADRSGARPGNRRDNRT